jgi:uncharacterized SAM-binding protein YcdF (DUF218 family)
MTYVQPLLLLFTATTVLGLLMVRAGKGKYVAMAGVLGLILISWPPADRLLGYPLEARYPVRPFVAPPGLEAIVVLGSAVDPVQYERPYPLPDKDTFSRCEHAAWIYKRWGPLPVLACEGQQSPMAQGMMRTLLQRAGVTEKMIWIEQQSRSTHENALYGARILRSHGVKRIALVVEGQSMPRAAACFRKEGIDVVPAPSELRTWGPLTDELLPNWRAVRRNEITLHEIAGLVWYWLRGWI